MSSSISLANRIAGALNPSKKKLNILLDIPDEQRKELQRLLGILREYQQFANFYMELKSSKPDYIISTNPITLRELTNSRKVTLDEYGGSLIGNTLFIYPTYRYWTSNGDVKFIVQRWIEKIIFPERYYHAPQFTWALVGHDATIEEAEDFISNSILSAWDIENSGREDLIPSINGISGLHADGTCNTYVFDFREWEQVRCLQRLANTPHPKVTQNGTYDITYYFRWGMPLRNWMFDTFNMFHAWYAELPRDLAFITGFMVQNLEFWKDEANGSFMEYCRYNAKDAFSTLHSCIAILREWPDWAKRNYQIQFPLQFPLIQAGMLGLKIDEEVRQQLQSDAQDTINNSLARIRKIVGDENFNPSSPTQVAKLIQTLGCPDIKTSSKTDMEAFSFRHPFNASIAELIADYREAVKAKSNYYDVLTLHGRLLYKFLAAGTDSGRLAAKASDFAFNLRLGDAVKPVWKHYGFQLQNVPYKAKKMIVADEGFLLYEADKEQAETRATAYLAQEPNLIHRVEYEPDFHCANVTAFFGIPFDQVYDPNGKTKDERVLLPDIRQLTKKLNHGASYNMAWMVLLLSMGEKNVWKAKSLLQLPNHWGLREITQFLIDKFCAAVPRLKGIKYSQTSHTKGVQHLFTEHTYYAEIISEVKNTGKLVSPLGWTRRCFDDPMAHKPGLNKYVAHPSQNLSVADVNEGIMRIWNDPRLKDLSVFRLNGQVHDSIVFQIKIGMEDEILPIIKDLFARPITVHGRSMLIPVDVSKGKRSWK